METFNVNYFTKLSDKVSTKKKIVKINESSNRHKL